MEYFHLIIESLFDVFVYDGQEISFFDIAEIETGDDGSFEKRCFFSWNILDLDILDLGRY